MWNVEYTTPYLDGAWYRYNTCETMEMAIHQMDLLSAHLIVARVRCWWIVIEPNADENWC
jgi:hypothetical protein